MKKYDIIYSIGADCACALYLKQAKLRLTSGPFDWLTNASFEDRFTLMLNNFECFLEERYLKIMAKPEHFPADKNNDYYENTKTHLYFWHDFPADVSFKESYPLIKKKYERRIKRFYDNLKNKNKVLLVWFSQNHQTADETIVKLCNRFTDKIGRKIDFLIIEHREEGKTEQRMLTDNIERWHCYARKCDEKGVPLTKGNEEVILPIFLDRQLIIPFATRIKMLLAKILLKFICLFIPIKKYRKRIRAIYKN